MTAESFIEAHGLKGIMGEAYGHLNDAFGYAVQPKLRIFCDPENGSESLFVEIPSSDPWEADGYLSAFCYDWWFNQVGNINRLIGFRVVATA